MSRSYDNLQFNNNEERETLELFFERLDAVEPSLRQEAEDRLKAYWSIKKKGSITEQDFLVVFRTFEKKFGDMETNFAKVRAWFEAENKKRSKNLQYTQDQLTFLASYHAMQLVQRFELFKFAAFSLTYRSKDGGVGTAYHPGDELLVSPQPLTSSFFGEKPVVLPPKYNPNYWHRGFNRYPGTDKEGSEEIVGRNIPFFGQKNVADIGRGEGYFLSLVKQKLGKKVKTHGVGMIDFHTSGSDAIDDDRVQPAEMLPWEWSNSMDLVFSNVAFEYFLFPELGLREVVRIMKKSKSEAHLHVDDQFHNAATFGTDKLLEFLGISSQEFNTIMKANFANFADKESISAMVEKIAQEQGVRLRVTFDHYRDNYKLIHLYID
jgi:ubiquinone/menaquinone biosynthesis C-methylase UbiE